MRCSGWWLDLPHKWHSWRGHIQLRCSGQGLDFPHQRLSLREFTQLRCSGQDLDLPCQQLSWRRIPANHSRHNQVMTWSRQQLPTQNWCFHLNSWLNSWQWQKGLLFSNLALSECNIKHKYPSLYFPIFSEWSVLSIGKRASVYKRA